MDTKFETIVVGGGPAGLSAAIHLAWHNRKVLVIDRKTGPLIFTLEKLYNVPGMPEHTGPEIIRKLETQAKGLGAELARGNVIKAEGALGDFRLEGAKGESWSAKTLVLATGVARYHPTIDGDYMPCLKYAGKGNLYYCPDCEAPEVVGKDTLVIGAASANGAAGLAVGLRRYTNKLRVLLTEGTELSEERAAQLKKKSIEVFEGKIQEYIGEKRTLKALVMKNGQRFEAEAFFVAYSMHGRIDLAKQLGVEIAATGQHMQPKSQRGDTNIPGVWIAGDIRPMTQQVSVAMGTGNLAAIMIDQYLRKLDVE